MTAEASQKPTCPPPPTSLAHLPRPSGCQKPHVSWPQQQLQRNRHLKVILPQGNQHEQEPSSLPSLQLVLCRGP